MTKDMPCNWKVLSWLNALTAVAMVTCIFTGQLKISFMLFGFSFMFPASNIFFALLTFPITDLIADIYGKKCAQTTVWIGFISQIITILIIELCVHCPGDTSSLMPFRAGGWRVLFGSSIAYLTAQFWDVYIFHLIKEKWTGDRHLWIRNNISTFSSQVINSSLFICIVFGLDACLLMLPGSLIVKFLLALADTPFVYLGRRIVLSIENKQFRSIGIQSNAIYNEGS